LRKHDLLPNLANWIFYGYLLPALMVKAGFLYHRHQRTPFAPAGGPHSAGAWQSALRVHVATQNEPPHRVPLGQCASVWQFDVK
jgi:hypothetical protein